MGQSQSIVAIEPISWALLKEQAEVFSKSGIMPPHIKNHLQALVVIQMGAELGYGPMQAINSIDLINGRLTLKAQTMRAKIFEKKPNCLFHYKEASETICTIETARDKSEPAMTFSYSIDEARKAGLIKPGSAWAKSPTDMLIARCTSRVARAVFPDCLMGIPYTPEDVIDANIEEQQNEVYDKESDDHKKRLIDFGKIYGVPLSELKIISEEMHGKTFENLEQRIKGNK